MENNQNTCRHEYVKIYQRKYKNYNRRLVSTRCYLPTGFSNKDFSFLTAGAYCFCTKCRKCLYPVRHRPVKAESTTQPTSTIDTPNTVDNENIWSEEIPTQTTPQEIDVEELQVETVEVSDIADKGIVEISTTQQNADEKEDGEE